MKENKAQTAAKEKYETPEMTRVEFDFSDKIAASYQCGGMEGLSWDGENPKCAN